MGGLWEARIALDSIQKRLCVLHYGWACVPTLAVPSTQGGNKPNYIAGRKPSGESEEKKNDRKRPNAPDHPECRVRLTPSAAMW